MSGMIWLPGLILKDQNQGNPIPANPGSSDKKTGKLGSVRAIVSMLTF
jgi:hypothetical protein